MFSPQRVIKNLDFPFGGFTRMDDNYTMPVAKRRYQDFIEILAEGTIVITLPTIGEDTDTFIGGAETTYTMNAGDWIQFVYLGDHVWGRRGGESTISG